MRARTILTMMTVILLSAAASAWAVGIEAAVGVWNQDPKGDFSYQGQRLDLEDELRYDEETRVTGRVKLELPLVPGIYLMATPMKFEGDGSKSVPFTFGGTTYAGTLPFHSKLELNHYDLALYYGIPFLKTVTMDVLNIELGVNGRLIDMEAEVSQTGLSTESKSVTYVIPMVYAGVQIRPVDWLALEGEARGISYSGNQYYDLIGRGKIIFLDHLFAAGGYRYEKLKIDTSDIKGDMEFAGPFGEVGIQF